MKSRLRSFSWLTGLSLVSTLAGACAVVDDGPPDENEKENQTESALGAGDTRWVNSGVSGVVQIQMTHNHDGSLAVIGRTTGGGLVFAEQVSPGGGWTNPASLGGWGLQDFSVAEQADGRLVVFALGGDGAIYAQTQNAPSSTAFSGWSYLAGSQLKDVAAARQPDGRIVMLGLGSDNLVYERLQASPNGGFNDWSYVGGPGVIQIAMAPQASGRLALLGRTSNGEMMFTTQPSANANFLGWTTLDGWQLKDFSLARNADGRLEMVAIGGDAYAYDKPQARPDLEWGAWSSIGQGGVTSVATTLAGDGSLNIFMIGADQQIHRVAQNGPGAGLISEPAMGGNHLVQVSAERDLDGRMEVMGLGADHVVYQTWQAAPNGGWLSLPAAPSITYTTATPSPAQVGSTVTVSWQSVNTSGCSSYAHVDISSPLSGNRQIGAWSNTNAAQATFTIQDDTTITLTVGCSEGQASGVTLENKVHWSVHATQPQNVQYVQWLSQEIPYSGPIPYGAIFGQGIANGKLLSLKNQNNYIMSLIGPSATNNDCWTSKAVNLSPQQTTTAANIASLFGSQTPALPLHIRACLSQGISGYAPILITYTYPH